MSARQDIYPDSFTEDTLQFVLDMLAEHNARKMASFHWTTLQICVLPEIDEVPRELFASGDPIDDLARWADDGGPIV